MSSKSDVQFEEASGQEARPQTGTSMAATPSAGFNITDGKGVHLTFENGWTVSVQWGAGNYSDNYDLWRLEVRPAAVPASRTAETAAWGPDGVWLEDEDGQVQGHQTPEQVLALLNRVAAFPAKASAQ